VLERDCCSWFNVQIEKEKRGNNKEGIPRFSSEEGNMLTAKEYNFVIWFVNRKKKDY